MIEIPRCVGNQPIGQAFCGYGREEARMRVSDLIKLSMQSGNDIGMAVTQAGDRGTSGGVNIGSAGGILQFDPSATDNNR